MTEVRVRELEVRVAEMDRRLADVEGRVLPLPPPPAVAPVWSAPEPSRPKKPEPAPAPVRPRVDLEDLFAGRALAWLGGAATLLGIVLLLVMAAARGWIGEEARVMMAAAGSFALFVAGGRLYELRGRTDAAAAMTAVGVLGLDAALVAAASLYELIAPLPALGCALAIATVATALCLRWQALAVARATMLGALAAPLVLGATGDPRAIAFLAVAYASVALVSVRKDWGGLGLAAFAIVTPQWTGILAGLDDPAPATTLVILTGFAALGVAIAAGLELREASVRLRHSAAFLLALNALASATAGYFILGGALADAWLVGVALVHLLAGFAPRLENEVRLTALTVGVLLGDVAAAAVLDDGWLVGAWVGSTLLFAVLNRRDGDAQPLLGHGLALHTALAVGHVLAFEAQGADPGGIALLAVVAAACLVSGQLSRAQWRVALQGAGLALVAYATALSLDGTALAVAFAVEAIALAGLARREDAPAATAAALGFLAFALGEAFTVGGGLPALVSGLDDVLAGVAALAAVTVAAAIVALRLPPTYLGFRLRVPLVANAALTGLFLASAGLVTAFRGDGVADAQVLLSAFWALTGVVALVAGLRSDARPLRIGALGLLAVALGKVVLYDLSELTDLYRVLSCIALGLLLLVGAFAWQRLRPRVLDDLRSMPGALR